MQKLLNILIYITTSSLLISCGNKLPDCSSKEAKDLLISILKESVVGNKDNPWYIETKFSIINTVSTENSTNSCHAQIGLSIPAEWSDKTTKNIEVDYKIQVNEAEKNTFSVSAKTTTNEIKEFNDLGWNANQNYLYKKAGLDFLAPENFKEIENNSKANPLLAFAALSILNYANVKEKLTELNWKYDGTGQKDKSVEIFSKEGFILNLKTETVPLFGTFIKPDDSSIWVD